MYCVNPHGPSKEPCTTMNGWLGSRWAGNSVWSPPSLGETEKGTFNPVGSLRCHRQKEMHSFSSFSQLFHEDWRKRMGKKRREESSGEEVGVEEERTATDVKKSGGHNRPITGPVHRLPKPLGACSCAALRMLTSHCFVHVRVWQCKRGGSKYSWTPSADRACVYVCACI